MRRIVYYLIMCFCAAAISFMPKETVNAALLSRMYVDEPGGSTISTPAFNVRGWALNPSGISQVNIYSDGKLMGNAQIGLDRPDVNKAFPGYIQGENSGFLYNVDSSLLGFGKHVLRIEAVGTDGSKQYTDKGINIEKAPNRGYIDEPSAAITSGSLTVRGWALNSSGVSAVKIYLNGAYVCNAATGLDRTDVNNVFPGYPGGDKSGFLATLDVSNFSPNYYSVKVEALGKDGTVYTMMKSFELRKLPNRMYIDEPGSSSIMQGTVTVRGWALNPSGLSKVNVYYDNGLIGLATLHLERPDVNNAYPGYQDGDKAGFIYEIPASFLKEGKHTIAVEAVGVDGTKQINTKQVQIISLKPQMYLDEPYTQQINNQDIRLRGWALNGSGVKEIKVFMDEKPLSNAAYGSSRPDIPKVFPLYPDAGQSGFFLNIPVSTVAPGNHSMRIEAWGNDGTYMQLSKSITVNKPSARTFLDEPLSTYKEGDEIYVRGWALNASGIKNIQVYVDGNLSGEAELQLARPDVDNAYPGYPGGDVSGFRFKLGSVAIGTHKVSIIASGNDGSTDEKEKDFQVISKLSPIGYLDEPSNNAIYSNNPDKITVRGWALNAAGVKEIKVYLNNQLMGNAQMGLDRPDILKVYPGYPNAGTSGYLFEMDASKVPAGINHITVSVYGNNGDVQNYYTNFKKGRLIVIDPGHNYGGDDGAYSKIDGVSYCERNLNMQVASKLKSSLEALGFSVVMTRNETDVTYESQIDSLAKRVDIANNLNADLFISIHHDASDSASASGVSTHWSSWRPNIDNSGTFTVDDITYDNTPCQAAIASRDFANLLVNKLASGLGYVNRGSRDHNLYVTRNTNVPSVLLELGFITNKSDAVKAADQDEQLKAAELIANTINDYFNN